MNIQIRKLKKRWFPGKETFWDSLMGWQFWPLSYQGKRYMVEIWEERRKKGSPREQTVNDCVFRIYEYPGSREASPENTRLVYTAKNLCLEINKDPYHWKYMRNEDFFLTENGMPCKEVLVNLPEIMAALFEAYEKHTQKELLMEEKCQTVFAWDGQIGRAAAETFCSPAKQMA